MTKTVAVFGLGSMGGGMAQSLIRAGHQVHGADVDAGAVARMRAAGGRAEAPGAVAAKLDAVVVVVLNAAQMDDVLFGPDGIAPRMTKGAVVIGCPTVPPEFARSLSERCAALGLHYLDAPISGGSVKAAEGALSMMTSGTPEAYEASEEILDALAEKVFRLGDSAGPGSAMKAVNQLLAGVHIAAMAEALTFGISQGIAPAEFVEVISQCAGTSWMLENRAPHVVAGDYTPHSAVDIWLKDLGIVLDVARQSNFHAPITATALRQFTEASKAGFGREDDAAVAKIYARNGGVTLPGDV